MRKSKSNRRQKSLYLFLNSSPNNHSPISTVQMRNQQLINPKRPKLSHMPHPLWMRFQTRELFRWMSCPCQKRSPSSTAKLKKRLNRIRSWPRSTNWLTTSPPLISNCKLKLGPRQSTSSSLKRHFVYQMSYPQKGSKWSPLKLVMNEPCRLKLAKKTCLEPLLMSKSHKRYPVTSTLNR